MGAEPPTPCLAVFPRSERGGQHKPEWRRDSGSNSASEGWGRRRLRWAVRRDGIAFCSFPPGGGTGWRTPGAMLVSVGLKVEGQV
ncbi:hypothetical protein chiPu_0012960 [Chiloscyllium punctatum]|uniref:Uncharacterized protein n=1 Tax=Chiloscyllium punctatum TaxID=137246 RepID=A0A401SVU7_CHIPU|nr:hypothetical protein [Chiloscyllium punctatum]